jgi:hypothetical protein
MAASRAGRHGGLGLKELYEENGVNQMILDHLIDAEIFDL